MSLADVQELAQLLGTDVDKPGLGDAIDIAELLLGQTLGGALAEKTLSGVKITPKRDRHVLELEQGPLTTLTTVSVGGVVLSASLLSPSFWGIGYENGFGAWALVTLAYKTGWTKQTIPADLRRAVLETAAARLTQTGRSGILAERIGDYAVTYTQAEAERTLPGVAVQLAQQYRKPFAV